MTIITNNTGLCDKAVSNLKTVYDPELGLNVIDLGLILQLDFDEARARLYANMTLTTRFCPMGQAITTAVQQCLEATFPGYAVDLHLSFDTPWNAEFISEEGRKQLEH